MKHHNNLYFVSLDYWNVEKQVTFLDDVYVHAAVWELFNLLNTFSAEEVRIWFHKNAETSFIESTKIWEENFIQKYDYTSQLSRATLGMSLQLQLDAKTNEFFSYRSSSAHSFFRKCC